MATNKSDFTIHVTSPAGRAVSIKPGAEIPAWAVKQIDNPYVTQGVDPDAPLSDDDTDPEDDLDDEDDGSEDGTGGPPPKSGKGSGVRAWRAYAAANGVDGEGLDVDEIIGALDSVGVPTE